MRTLIKKIIALGRIAAFRNSVNSVRKQYKCLDMLEKKTNKTDLEIDAWRGLKCSLICKWIVAICFTVIFCLGIFTLLRAGDIKDAILGDYYVETSYVKNGYIRYGSEDKEYYVGDLDYEENTWLYVLMDKESKEVEAVKEMKALNDEVDVKGKALLEQAGIIIGGAFLVLFFGLFLALGIFEKPFRKWYAEYSLEHPEWYENL